jgi:hypothetical protein
MYSMLSSLFNKLTINWRDQEHEGDDLIDDVRAMLNRPSAITQLQSLPQTSSLRIKLTNFLSDPANASLDVTNRLIIGTRVAGGAHADVYDGKFSSSDIDVLALRPILQNKGRMRRQLKRNPIRFEKVAVKQLRLILLINGDGARVRECCMISQVINELICHLVSFTRAACVVTSRPSQHPASVRIRFH